MAQKEYLKMADAFEGCVTLSNSYVMAYYSDSNSELRWGALMAGYAAHAINSHDELVAEVKRLRLALHDAATSLETIHIRSFGEESMLDSKQEMRAYAGARAMVARKDLRGE